MRTLKATTAIFNNEVCSTLTAMSSRTLLSDHVGGFITKKFVTMHGHMNVKCSSVGEDAIQRINTSSKKCTL